MFQFSKKSMKNLRDIHRNLIHLMTKVLEILDISIVEGLRSPEKQASLFAAGKSRTLESKYLTGLAVDVAPYPIDWEDTRGFYFLAGVVRSLSHVQEISVRWGGDWNGNNQFSDQTFYDLADFELNFSE